MCPIAEPHSITPPSPCGTLTIAHPPNGHSGAPIAAAMLVRFIDSKEARLKRALRLDAPTRHDAPKRYPRIDVDD